MPTTRSEGRLHLRKVGSGERGALIERMELAGRQTHTLRMRPLGNMYLVEAEDAVAGWAGFDFRHNPSYPELFSLYVYPGFRGRGVARALELVRYREAEAHGIRHAYIRVGSSVSPKLTRKRLESGCFRFLENVERSFARLCATCPEKGTSCVTQQFMIVDMQKRAAQITADERGIPAVLVCQAAPRVLESW